jgi:glycosyltransferase involved in cell wall biosynthesis
MQILQINTADLGGGAEKVAFDLHINYLEKNHDARFLVGRKKGNASEVIKIPKTRWQIFWDNFNNFSEELLSRNFSKYLRTITKRVANPYRYYTKALGYENYHFPASRKAVDKLIETMNVVHFHNIHGNYFDLRYLPTISNKKPTLITLHDEYLYTGHCAYTLGCERWKIGCGDCPHLDVYPAVERDATQRNWQVKQRILQQSEIVLVSPSQWLASRVKQSFLKDKNVRVIPNGIDQNVYKPGDKREARQELDLPKDAFILLYAASRGRKSKFKDYDMLDRVVEKVGNIETQQQIVFLALGGEQYRRKEMGQNIFIETPYIKDQSEVVKYYQACDIYIHTSKADNFPLVILEAMACGKPIVATNAGGIPEQVQGGVNGFVVPIGDDGQMVKRIVEIINSPDLQKDMEKSSLATAQEHYTLENMVNSYLDLYRMVINEYGSKQ